MDYIQYLPAMRAATNKATDSNDPDSQVGALFVKDESPQHLPRRIAGGANIILLDFQTREEKLLASAHAEKMAIAAAHDAGWANLSALTLIVTRHPCSHCMIDIWLSGCKRVVYLDRPEDATSSWQASFVAARAIAAKYHIDLIKVPREALYSETADVPSNRRKTNQSSAREA